MIHKIDCIVPALIGHLCLVTDIKVKILCCFNFSTLIIILSCYRLYGINFLCVINHYISILIFLFFLNPQTLFIILSERE